MRRQRPYRSAVFNLILVSLISIVMQPHIRSVVLSLRTFVRAEQPALVIDGLLSPGVEATSIRFVDNIASLRHSRVIRPIFSLRRHVHMAWRALAFLIRAIQHAMSSIGSVCCQASTVSTLVKDENHRDTEMRRRKQPLRILLCVPSGP